MKGLFIPEITAEMFRNGCLESIEALMTEGKTYDIEYSPWIPVSEKMPEEDGYYVVSGGGKVWVCEMLNLTNTVKGWCNSIQKPSVEAWMPLPQPYKAESEDKG